MAAVLLEKNGKWNYVHGEPEKIASPAGGDFGELKREYDDPIRAAAKTVRKLRHGFFRMLFLRGFLSAFGVAAFVAGAAVLAVRFFAESARLQYFAGILVAALLASLLRGLFYARKHLPDSRRLLVWLDGASACGGLLAASLETDPGAWRNSIPPPPSPRLTVSAGRGLLFSVIGLLFLAGALLFPESAVPGRVHHTLDLSGETAALEQKIEVLEEESLMPEKELVDLKDGVAELKEKNDAANPAAMFEMLDALSRRVGMAGEEAASRIRQNHETLQMLSSALDTIGALPGAQIPPEAAAQMGELLNKLAEENPDLAELLKQSGASLSALDPETMKRLAEAMRDSSGKLEKQLAKLVKSKLSKSSCSKPGKCSSNCESGGPGGDRELAEWLEQNAPGADELRMVVVACMAPGNGGVSRGRGDAALLFSGETAGFAGKEVDLALDGGNDPARSMTVQQFAAAPNPGAEERQAAAAGHLRGGDAQLDRSENRIYPAHRAAVERYFKPKGERSTP